jgi:hypothetical protein
MRRARVRRVAEDLVERGRRQAGQVAPATGSAATGTGGTAAATVPVVHAGTPRRGSRAANVL